MARVLSKDESGKAGYAVGTLFFVVEQMLKGNYNFSEEQLEQIAEANEILNDFTPEEQIELFERGLKEGGLNG